MIPKSDAAKKSDTQLQHRWTFLTAILLCVLEASHAYAQVASGGQWRVRTSPQPRVESSVTPVATSIIKDAVVSDLPTDTRPKSSLPESVDTKTSPQIIHHLSEPSSNSGRQLPSTQGNQLVAVALQENDRKRPPSLGVLPPIASDRERYREYFINETQADSTLTLFVNRPRLLHLAQPPIRTYIPEAGGSILALRFVDPDNATQLAIEPLKVGSTVLTLWFRDANAPGGEQVLSWLVNVTEDPERSRLFDDKLSRLEVAINRTFPNSAVSLSYVGSQVVIQGQAKDVEEAANILRIVSSEIQDVEDQDNREWQRKRQFQSTISTTIEAPGNAPVTATVNSEGDAFSEGEGGSSTIVPKEAAFGSVDGRIVNLLEVAGVHQVMLKVTVAEVNRSAFRDISATMGLNGNRAGFNSRFKANTSPGSVINNIPLGGVNIAGGTVSVNAGDFSFALNALKQMNLAKSLAEPTLTTLNGQPANFRAGDTFPVPQTNITNGGNSQQVNQSFVGIRVSFLPIVTDHNRIRLSVQGNVSTRDDQAGASIGGTAVPGTTTRDFQTNVEMREGETLALAGLINTSTGSNSSRVPFVGDIPGLGRFFAADGGSSSEQELIVLVTPYLVNPVDTNETPIALPGSDYFEPDDVEFFLKGSLTGHIAEDYRSPVRTDIHKMTAFRRCEQQMIIGQPGHSNGLLCPPANPNPMRQGVQQ